MGTHYTVWCLKWKYFVWPRRRTSRWGHFIGLAGMSIKYKRPQPSLKNRGRHSNAPRQGGDDDRRMYQSA